MRQLIQFHINSADEQQQALEQQLAQRVESTYRRNLRAFTQTVPGIHEKLTSDVVQRMSLFANKHGEPNIVDYTNGRAFYGEFPKRESELHVDGFRQFALKVKTHTNDALENIVSREPLPSQCDVLVVLGIGLGHSLEYLLEQHNFSHIILYEPNIDLFKCSSFVLDWASLLSSSSRKKTAIYFQIGESGTNLLSDIKELKSVAKFSEFFIYKHYNSPVFDSICHQLEAKTDSLFENQNLNIKHQYSYTDFCPTWTAAPITSTLPLLNNETSLWQRNLNAFKHYFPDIAKQFEEFQPQTWLPVVEKDGRHNLFNKSSHALYFDDSAQRIAEQEFSFFSRYPNKNGLVLGYTGEKLKHYHHYQFVIKTESLVESVEEEVAELPNKIKSFILFGMSNPYVLNELLSHHDVDKLFICEPSLDLFYASLFEIDWADLLKTLDERECHLYINVGDDGTNLTKDLIKQFYSLGPYLLAQTYIYQSYANDVMDAALVNLQEQLKLLLSMGDYFDHAFYGINHTRQMIERGAPILLAHPQKRLSAEDKSVPIVLVGNGPSLDHSIDAIKDIAEQSIIVSCGTALKTLYECGITPDFHCEIEQNRSTFDWACRVGSFDYLKTISLLSCNGIHPDTCSLYKDTYICFKEGEASTVTWSSIINKQALHLLEFAFPTVANFALDLFSSLQPENLYLMGVDLGYTDLKKHHSEKSGYYDESGEELYDYVTKNHSVLQIKGNFQPTVYTKHEFKISKMVMEETLQSRRLDVYNCSNGAYIQGTTPLHLDHILVSSTVAQKQMCVNTIKHTLFNSDFNKTASARFDELLQVNAVIDDCKSIKQQVKDVREKDASDVDIDSLVEAQRDILVKSVQENSSLVFYYLYGSVNYASAVLSKLSCSNLAVRERCIPECLDYWAECMDKVITTFQDTPDKRDESASMRWLRIKSVMQSRLDTKRVLLVTNSSSFIQAVKHHAETQNINWDLDIRSFSKIDSLDSVLPDYEFILVYIANEFEHNEIINRIHLAKLNFAQEQRHIIVCDYNVTGDIQLLNSRYNVMQMDGDTNIESDRPYSHVLHNAYHAMSALCYNGQETFILPKIYAKNGIINARYDKEVFQELNLNWYSSTYWLVGRKRNSAQAVDYDGFGESLMTANTDTISECLLYQNLSESVIVTALEQAKQNTPFILLDDEYV